ncbi:MAG: hypothetical protein KF830_17150 [Planctomycetes bacterium]|nr:hypothetical protein [Planctomycetota bacterium]
MDGIDDLFEYALDLPPAAREDLYARLAAEDPALAQRLRQLVAQQVQNPDFACHLPAAAAPAPGELRRVTLVVGDVAAAAAWYADVFGCPVRRQDARRAVLALGAVELHLVRDGLEPPSLTIGHRGLVAAGPTRSRDDGMAVRRLVDPWGNALEVEVG